MTTWQKIVQLFYQYKTDVLLYVEHGKPRGLLHRDDFMGSLSDLDNISSELFSFVTITNNIDEVLMYLEKSEVYLEDRKALPVINEKFGFLALWDRVDIIKTWENLDTGKSGAAFEGTNRNNTKMDSLDQKLAVLAMETLPIGMLALDTTGKQILYNEDWLALKKKYPRELTTNRIIRNAKNFMAEEAYKPEVNLKATFSLHTIIPRSLIKMRLIRYENTTIGYLFWHAETPVTNSPASSGYETEFYDGKTLKEILNEKEKQILIWAMEQAKGKVAHAAKILGVPRQTFRYRYDRLHKKAGKK